MAREEEGQGINRNKNPRPKIPISLQGEEGKQIRIRPQIQVSNQQHRIVHQTVIQEMEVKLVPVEVVLGLWIHFGPD